jgi:hypothetical protein
MMIAKSLRIFLILLLAIITVGGVRTVSKNNSQNIAMKPLTLDHAHPGMRRVGELIFLQAWELGSSNTDFGGISALTALPDGRFVGVSDAGTLIGFGLTSDDRTDRPFIAPLPESQGNGKTYKDRDSEGIAFDSDSGQFWVSYESKHAIRRFSRSFSRSTGTVPIKGEYAWPNNKGVEAIIRLPDGRFVAIAENLEGGKHEGFLYSGDPVEQGTSVAHFNYRPPAGYRVTDGTVLPDGRLLVLNRSIGFPKGFAAKLAVLDPLEIKADSTITAKVIATLAAPLLVDNMEGVAVTQNGDDVIVWLISDDNFSIWQRTLLMKFRLSERAQKKKPEASPAPGFDSL